MIGDNRKYKMNKANIISKEDDGVSDWACTSFEVCTEKRQYYARE